MSGGGARETEVVVGLAKAAMWLILRPVELADSACIGIGIGIGKHLPTFASICEHLQ